MKFGACYYPEHWPEDRWETDMKLMKEADFNWLRMAEFSWAKIEPEEGVYNFEWLDRCIALMNKYNIKAVLGTPTAAPPKWLMNKHEDIYPCDEKGIIKGFGTRRHYCFNSPNYHNYTQKITEKMAEHYQNTPNVMAWQIDNEFGMADTSRCYCENCRKMFQQWLENKYKHINTLNETWGTVYWSQTYHDWEDVVLPKYTTGKLHNPALQLDYRRFCSDAVVEYQKMQVDIIRKLAPHQKVTTNFMGVFPDLNYYDMAKGLDLAALDIYPNLSNEDQISASPSALEYTQTRSLKKGNYWVTEMQSGSPGGNIIFRTPKPGELRSWTYQAIAHGADGILYFRWRGILFGNEQFWHGILPHSGKVNRRYKEAQQVGAELKRIGVELEGSSPRSKVAIMRSYDNQWAFEIQPQMSDFDYTEHLKTYFDYFHKRRINADVISPRDPMENYDLIIIPTLFLSDDRMVSSIVQYVRSGGTVIMDIRSGAKSWDSQMEPLTLPGNYSDLLGIEIDDYGIIIEKHYTQIHYEQNKKSYKGYRWYDVIESKGAEVLASYDSDYFKGMPAVTRNLYGNGTAYYLGTVLEENLLDEIMDEACKKAGVYSPIIDADLGIEMVSRSKGDTDYWFVINHNDEQSRFYLPVSGRELLTDHRMNGEIQIQSKGVMIFEILGA